MSPIDDKAADESEIAALLARSPFAGQSSGAAPLLVVAARAPARIVFVNDAVHALFRTGDLRQINAALLTGASPGARRLRQLTNAATAGARPRLELLRFFVGRLPLQLGLHCAGVANAQGETFLVAGTPASAAEAAAAQETEPPGQADPPAPAKDQDRASDGAAARRFLWSVNERSCFDAPSQALVAAVGDDAPSPGESLDALKARTGLDLDCAFARALASQATFGALRLAWPRTARQHPGKEAIIIVLSGAPIFDRRRRFFGYRGFGVFTGETVLCEAQATTGDASQDAQDAGELDHSTTAADPARVGKEIAASGAQDGPVEADGPTPPPIAPAPAKPATMDEAPLVAQGSERESQPSPERSAEIVPLRATGQGYTGAPNVVPIRPGALPAFLAPDEGAQRGESVELTNHERDAFREIARALGAKIRDHREGRKEPAPDGAAEVGAPDQTQDRDLIDLAAGDPPRAASAPAHAAAADASELLDRLPIGALVTRGEEPLYLNRTLLDLLGYRDLAQFRAESGVAGLFGEGQPEQIAAAGGRGELSLISATGETIAVTGQILTVKWAGAPATLISLRRSVEGEVASRLRALEFDARRRETEAFEVSAILDTAADGVVVLDSQGRILSLNRPAEALFGFDQKEVAGENFLMLFSPESREPVKAYFDGLQASGLGSLLNDGREALGRERQGRAIPLFVVLGRINASGEPKFCAVLRDMTPWKATERDLQEARGQAEKANALKSDFLAKISHEIRTPLNAIIGFAEVMIEERFGPVGNDRYKDYVKDIHASGAHVMSLVNDLLDLSKIEAGKLDLNLAAVDANSIIQECVSLMQPQAAHERIIMRLSLFDKLPKIVADERSLRQIMLNLMSNAVKFNEPGGQVIVSTAMNDSGQAVIRVRDTGIGMSEAEVGAALEPFQQIATARPTNGTGLGLPLTKALAEANRAGFSIKSRKEQGTLVEVAFPTAQAAAAQ
jgi:PAS domain S-box-containing protein